MDIQRIIREEINRFIREDEEKTIKRGAIKKINGQRGDFNKSEYEYNNKKATRGDEESVISRIPDFINVSALAQSVIKGPTTPEGKQSEFRKKINHEKSDSGSEYHLNAPEIRRLDQQLSKI